MREGGAGPAALLGEGGSRPGRRVRGCTLEPVWSTSSEKGDGRALRSRMARLFEGLLLSNFRTIGSLVKPRRERYRAPGGYGASQPTPRVKRHMKKNKKTPIPID